MQVRVGKKRDSWRICGFAIAAYRFAALYTAQALQREKQQRRTAASVKRHPTCCSHKSTTSCLWWAQRYMPETKGGQTPRTKPPLVITLLFCCRRTESGGYFCWKLTLTRTHDSIRPTRRSPDPNRPTNGSKQRGYEWDLRVVVSGGFWSDTTGDNRRQQNII